MNCNTCDGEAIKALRGGVSDTSRHKELFEEIINSATDLPYPEQCEGSACQRLAGIREIAETVVQLAVHDK